MLEFIEEALDEIALAIKREIAAPRGLAIGFRRDHRRDVSRGEIIEERVRARRSRPASAQGLFGQNTRSGRSCSHGDPAALRLSIQRSNGFSSFASAPSAMREGSHS